MIMVRITPKSTMPKSQATQDQHYDLSKCIMLYTAHFTNSNDSKFVVFYSKLEILKDLCLSLSKSNVSVRTTARSQIVDIVYIADFAFFIDRRSTKQLFSVILSLAHLLLVLSISIMSYLQTGAHLNDCIGHGQM